MATPASEAHPSPTPAARPLRAAIVGLGRMGSTFDDEHSTFSRWRPPHAHAASYRAVTATQLVAGSDPHPGQRDAFAQKWDVDHSHLYADFREMLARERPDVVSICTSARPRAAILRDVLEHGPTVRAIWVEKPISISLAEADSMIESCRRAGVLLAVGASRCWDATYNRMRELIDLGEIGDVLHVNAFLRCQLSHNGSHLLTLASYLAGSPQGSDGPDGPNTHNTPIAHHAHCRSVYGQVESDAAAQGDDDLAGIGFLEFDNGVHACVRTLPTGAADREVEVIGTRGRLRAIADAEEVEFWKLAPGTLPGRRQDPARHVFPRPITSDTANVRTVRDIVHCLESGTEPLCNGAAARQALEIAVAIRESHRRGGIRVSLPLQDRSLRINSAETLHGDEPAIVRRAAAATRAPQPAAR